MGKADEFPLETLLASAGYSETYAEAMIANLTAYPATLGGLRALAEALEKLGRKEVPRSEAGRQLVLDLLGLSIGELGKIAPAFEPAR
jgi:hypothetical protein